MRTYEARTVKLVLSHHHQRFVMHKQFSGQDHLSLCFLTTGGGRGT